MNVTATTLDSAAELIEEHGLARGVYWAGHPDPWPGNRPCCVFGALAVTMRVATGYAVLSPEARQLELHIQRHTGNRHLTITQWNDDRARTAQDAAATLRACAAGLREGKETQSS